MKSGAGVAIRMWGEDVHGVCFRWHEHTLEDLFP